ncbi:MAG: hypothetical protein SXA11_00085 [Cyanobacteriota bacterium]|nr:hypothetical protein [Cyanobacteriota bacterium]
MLYILMENRGMVVFPPEIPWLHIIASKSSPLDPLTTHSPPKSNNRCI